MKQLILAALMLAAMGCSHAKNSPPSGDAGCNEVSCSIKLPEAAAPAEIVKDTIQEDNWQFTLPEGWMPLQLDSDSNIKVAFKNSNLNATLFFVKERTPAAPVQYIISTMRTINAAGLKTTGADQVDINGRHFVMLTSSSADTIWTWITFNKGYAYVLGCGVADSDGGAAEQQLCQDVVNTLQIQ